MFRQAPMPPPKPRGYQSPMKMGELAPQDSDTDSGICADSDQSSPRQPSQPSFPSYSTQPQHLYRHLADDNRDYLTPNSARRLFSTATEPRRTLPPRPSVGTPSRTKTQFRVRFADEVDSGASTSSSISEQSNTSPRSDYLKSFPAPLPSTNNNFNKYSQTINDKRHENSLPRTMPVRRMSGSNAGTFTIDDIESLPGPPSYNIAVQRLRSHGVAPVCESVRDNLIRHNVQDTLSRTMRNRSASLPRGLQQNEVKRFFSSPKPMLDYQMNRLTAANLVGSLDNLRINTNLDYSGGTSIHDDLMQKRRKLPVAPLMGSNANIPDSLDAERESIRQPAYMRQRRCRGRVPQSQMTRRSASVGRYPDSGDYDYRSPEPSVRAQLIALDQRGFRTVLVEKTQPGPFGFYIATGVMNGQRGIFISRVSLPSLSPMLSIGDEILYVDDELVKGRTLEYVQSLIAGKTSVMIVLLPTISPALC